MKKIARRLLPRSLRNWLRSPSRSLEWILDDASFAVGRTKKLPFSREWTLVCHPAAYRIFLRDQIHDLEQAQEFRNFLGHCSASMHLFDVGAHFGIFSLAAAHAGGRAVAIDASLVALRKVKIEAELNGHLDRITIVHSAVSDKTGSIGLVSSGVFSAGYFKVSVQESESELTSLPSLTIDELTRQFGAPTHVKIDIEGHEAAALRGAAKTIEQCAPVLFLELHNEMVREDGGDPRESLRLINDFGYRIYDFAGGLLSDSDVVKPPISRIVALGRP